MPTQSATKSAGQPARWKRLFWYFAPVQSSIIVEATDSILVAESFPSPMLSTLGHVLYALLWVGAVTAYSIFVTYQHFTKPAAENFMQEPANQQPQPTVSIDAWCTQPGQCGAITITADYSQAPAWCRASGLPSYNHSWTGWWGLNGTRVVGLPLCYTGERVFSTNSNDPMPPSLGIIVDFERIWTGDTPIPAPPSSGPTAPPPPPPTWTYAARAFAVEQAPPPSSSSSYASKPTAAVRVVFGNSQQKLINLEAWQVKTVVLGQSVTYKDKVYSGTEVFPYATQYEGRRPTTRATAIISLAEFADVTRVERRAGDVSFRGWMTLLGTMCGMAFFMNSIQIFLEPCFVRCFPGPAELKRRQAGAVTSTTTTEEKTTADQPLLPVGGNNKSSAPLPPTRRAADGSGGSSGSSDSGRDPIITSKSATSTARLRNEERGGEL